MEGLNAKERRLLKRAAARGDAPATETSAPVPASAAAAAVGEEEGLNAKERRKRNRKVQQEHWDLKEQQQLREQEFIRQQEQELALFEQSRRRDDAAIDDHSQGRVQEAVPRPATLEAALETRNLGHLVQLLQGRRYDSLAPVHPDRISSSIPPIVLHPASNECSSIFLSLLLQTRRWTSI